MLAFSKLWYMSYLRVWKGEKGEGSCLHRILAGPHVESTFLRKHAGNNVLPACLHLNWK